MDVNWKPLPPRRKKSNSPESLVDINSMKKERKRVKVSDYQNIVDNIEARSKINRDNSTLESKDGCPGDFYEYLDHTADVQCHSWGKDIKSAFENMAQCLMNYMTDLSKINIDSALTKKITFKGHDMKSLLYNYMNELLFRFSTDGFCTKEIKIEHLDLENWEIQAEILGENFELSKHSMGTEVKAITYSNMQVHVEENGKCDLYVIIDI